MGQGGTGREFGLQSGKRTLRIGKNVLWFLPVGQKGADLALPIGIAAPEEMPGPPPGRKQVGYTGLLPRGEKWGMGGDAPLLSKLQLVQHTPQQDTLLPVAGAAVQQFLFGHIGSPLSLEVQYRGGAALCQLTAAR